LEVSNPFIGIIMPLAVPAGSAPVILRQPEGIFLAKILRALRGFAVNSGPDFHREGAKTLEKREELN